MKMDPENADSAASHRRNHTSRTSLDTSLPSYSDKDTRILRIAASDVAAVAGYNSWADVRELFLDRLLYQNLGHVLRRDAENLGLEVEDRSERTERLLAKAGDRELRKVRTRAGDGVAVATVKDARVLRDKTRSLLKNAERKSKLTKDEAKELEDELRYDINTQFGTRNEDEALRAYERQTGTEVFCSNDRKLVWPLPGARDGQGVPSGATEPPPSLNQGWVKRDPRWSLKRSRAESRESSRPSPSDSTFLSALNSCLDRFSVRTALEGTVERVVAGADCGGDKSVVSAPELGQVDLGTATSIGVQDEPCEVLDESREASRVRDADEVGMGGHEGGGSELAESPEGIAVGRKGPPAPNHERSPHREVIKELVPGVPYPEWRRAVLSPVTSLNIEENASIDRTQVLADQASPTIGSPSLWFPPILSSRHRAMVHGCATQRGLGHRSVDAADGRLLIVWDAPIVLPKVHRSSTARPKSDSCHSRLASPPDALSPVLDVNDADAKGDGAKTRLCTGKMEREAFARVPTNGDTMHRDTCQSSDAIAIDLTCIESSPRVVDQQPENVSCIPEDTGTRQSAVSGDGNFEITNGGSSARVEVDGSHAPGLEPAMVEDTDYCTRQERPSPGATQRVPASTSTSVSVSVSGQPHDCSMPPLQGVEEAEEVVVLERHPTSGARTTDDGLGPGEACFLLVGAVDGIAEEVIDAPEDADTWEVRRVVVEVKNRMGSVKHPPPLYDQIQLVTYMLMVGATVGDLVQFVKTSASAASDRRTKRGEGKGRVAGDPGPHAAEASEPPTVAISRVELDCSTYNHRKHWHAFVLPRLYEFARMVYKFRADDLLRWRYLLAGREEQRDMLVECCPYLDSVIPREPGRG